MKFSDDCFKESVSVPLDRSASDKLGSVESVESSEAFPITRQKHQYNDVSVDVIVTGALTRQSALLVTLLVHNSRDITSVDACRGSGHDTASNELVNVHVKDWGGDNSISRHWQTKYSKVFVTCRRANHQI